MSIEIDILTGEASLKAARPLLAAVWPPDGGIAVNGGSNGRAQADLRVLIETADDGVVGHAALYRCVGLWKGRKVRIGGVGSVATLPAHRKRGYAGLALRAAVQTLRDEEVIDFGLLFCEPAIAAFFEVRGWHRFDSGIQIEQNGQRMRLEDRQPYVFDIRNGPREGVIDLLGAPW